MSLKTTNITLEIAERQVISVPEFTKFLRADLHTHKNYPMLWALSDDEKTATEKVEIIILENEQELRPVSAKYVGAFKTNAGMKFVFASRVSDNPLTKVPHV